MVEILATSKKVAASRPDEANDFFSIYLILPAALGTRVYSGSNRNKYQKPKKFIANRARPVRRADNFIAVCELIVDTM
jgi:hypothetical protein